MEALKIKIKECPMCNKPYPPTIGIVARCKQCNLTESTIAIRVAIVNDKGQDLVVAEYNKVKNITTVYKSTIKEIEGFDLSIIKRHQLFE